MPRIYYDYLEAAEDDAHEYDEYYDHAQLRTGIADEGNNGYSVLYNAPWPRDIIRDSRTGELLRVTLLSDDLAERLDWEIENRSQS